MHLRKRLMARMGIRKEKNGGFKNRNQVRERGGDNGRLISIPLPPSLANKSCNKIDGLQTLFLFVFQTAGNAVEQISPFPFPFSHAGKRAGARLLFFLLVVPLPPFFRIRSRKLPFINLVGGLAPLSQTKPNAAPPLAFRLQHTPYLDGVFLVSRRTTPSISQFTLWRTEELVAVSHFWSVGRSSLLS